MAQKQGGFSAGHGLLNAAKMLNFSSGGMSSGGSGGRGQEHRMDRPQVSSEEHLSSTSMKLFSSLGLSPSDLDALAQIPEDQISVETLPHILRQLKNRKKQESFPEWDEPRSREGPSDREYSFRQDSGQSHDFGRSFGSGNFSQSRHDFGMAPSSSSAAYMQPAQEKVEDFLGLNPARFPHVCVLCDFDVHSIMEWNQHVNSLRHAENRRMLLNLYPDWEPPMASNRSGGMDAPNLSAGILGPAPMSGHSSGMSSNWGGGSGMSERDAMGPKPRVRVVEVMYERKPLSNQSLFNFVKPFGQLKEHLLLKNKGFLEMSNADQALDVVNYYQQNPASLGGRRLVFVLSKRVFIEKQMGGSQPPPKPAPRNIPRIREDPSTNSQVLYFSNLPLKEEEKNDLLTIAGRFGTVQKHLFLQREGFIQLSTPREAEMMAKYYTINPLEIRGKPARCNVCTKYKTLNVQSNNSKSPGSQAPRRERSGASSPRRSLDRQKRSQSPRARSREDRKREERSRSKSESKPKPKSEPKVESKAKSKAQSKAEPKVESKAQSKAEPKVESKAQSKAEPKVESKAQSKAEPKVESKAQSKAEPKVESKAQSKAEPKVESKAQSKAEAVDLKAESKVEFKAEPPVEAEKEESSQKDEASSTNLEQIENEKEPEQKGPDVGPEDMTEEVDEAGEVKQDAETEESKDGIMADAEESAKEDDDDDEDFCLENMEDMVVVDELEEDEAEAPDSSNTGGMRVVLVMGFRKGYNFLNELMQLAQPFGKVESHLIMDQQRKAYLQFTKEEEAVAMAKFYNGNVQPRVCGRPVKVWHYTSQPTIQFGFVVYIGKLPNVKYSIDDILEMVEKYGKVRKYFLHQFRHECYLEMETEDQAERVVEHYRQQPAVLYGQRLTIYVSRKYRFLQGRHVVLMGADKKTSKREREQDAKRKSSDEPASKKSKEEMSDGASKEKGNEEESTEETTKEKDEESSEETIEAKDEEESPAETKGKDEGESPEESIKGTEETLKKLGNEESGEETCQKLGEEENEEVMSLEDKAEEIEDSDQEMEGEKPVGEVIGETSEEEEDLLEDSTQDQSEEEDQTEPESRVLLPPFDPHTPVGVEHVQRGFYCGLCCLLCPDEEQARDAHCSSRPHYEQLQRHMEQKNTAQE
ncbi:unnamed protein product [Knipowitschia caucasica]